MIYSCILSKFYIKPQLILFWICFWYCCILSKFYIKPQLRRQRPDFCCVVSYRNSTSNHNSLTTRYDSRGVVSYRNSTSNHNQAREVIESLRLYLIEILHQTTTFPLVDLRVTLLYLIEILHQTTTSRLHPLPARLLYLIEILHQTTTKSISGLYFSRCILSKFYIKPQR